MRESNVPQPVYRGVEKIWVGTGRFLKERAEHTASRSMHLYDEKIIPRLSGKPKEIAENLRPMVEKAATIGGWSKVATELYLAGVSVGLAALLFKSIKDEGLGKTLLGDPTQNKRGLIHIPISAAEAVAATLRLKRQLPPESAPEKKPRLFFLSQANPTDFWLPPSFRNIHKRGEYITIVGLDESDRRIDNSTLQLDRLSPFFRKRLGAMMALLGTEDTRKKVLRHLVAGGPNLWNQYRQSHPPESDQCSYRDAHLHFDTFYNWLQSQAPGYDPSWIKEFLRRSWRSVEEILNTFVAETGYSLLVHTALTGDSGPRDIANAKEWLERLYSMDPYEA